MHVFTRHHWLSKKTEDKIFKVSIIAFVLVLSLILVWMAIDYICLYIVDLPVIPW